MVESSTATSDAAGLSKEGGQTDDIRVVVARIINNFLALLGILAIGLIIYAGFLWMTAGGNEEQISKAKKMILNATIGLFIILASFSISAFVINSIQQSSIAGGPTESSFCFSCMLW